VRTRTTGTVAALLLAIVEAVSVNEPALKLAHTLLATEWTREGLTQACRSFATASGRGWRAPAKTIATEVLRAYEIAPKDSHREFAEFLERLCFPVDPNTNETTEDAETDDDYSNVRDRRLELPNRTFRLALAPGRMLRNRWGVPIIHDVGELAAMLDVSVPDLQWFSDRRAYQVRETREPLNHYRYTWVPKGRGKYRLLEEPKPRLKAIQRQLLREIVGLIPTHVAVHGFVTGRSPVTAAEPHVGHRIALRLDIADFFGSVNTGRVYGIFRTCGYPEGVAHTLTGLVTNRLPNHLRTEQIRKSGSGSIAPRVRDAHLPQGAPTSPALANLAALGIDRRMTGLAASFEATYTRYADDLLISGGLALLKGRNRFIELVSDIVGDEGFRLQESKTAVMTNAGRQRMLGLVVNEKTNVSRVEYDALRATLHNCVVHGVESQQGDEAVNYQAHLLGKIGWVAQANPERGAKLLAMYGQISWP
jgi:RNA-directed DNA polymerase